MKNYSIDYLYSKIDKHILLVQSYTEINALSFIIKSCRLKPYDLLSKNKDYTLSIYNKWCDEFGNSLNIKENKKIQIKLNDLFVNKNNINCTDLYYGISLNKVAKLSKLVYIFSGIDEDIHHEYNFVAFLGIDNYLRCFMYLYDEWSIISPLYLGLDILKNIYDHLDIKYFLSLKNKNNFIMPCLRSSSWISSLPPKEDFIYLLNKETNLIVPTFFKKGNYIINAS